MQRPKKPCPPDCPERSGTCHAECPRYLAFVIYNEIWRDKIAQEKKRENDLFVTSRHNKKKKKRGCPYADNRGGY